MFNKTVNWLVQIRPCTYNVKLLVNHIAGTILINHMFAVISPTGTLTKPTVPAIQLLCPCIAYIPTYKQYCAQLVQAALDLVAVDM